MFGANNHVKLNELMRYWMQAVWNRRPKVLLRKQGMLMLVAVKVIKLSDLGNEYWPCDHAWRDDFTAAHSSE
jgi:hypothetical protein